MDQKRCRREEAVLVLVDYQERLMPAIKSRDDVEESAAKLANGCQILGVPILITQQYTKGLGPTVETIAQVLGDFQPIEKTSFSIMGEPAFVEALAATGRKSVILAGVEAHVCVLQSALDLLEAGYQVFLAIDAVSSRSNTDKKYAQRRMAEAGAVGTTVESVLFELLVGAREPGFKEISALVK
jgi:nicotinamidase-related amidase